MVRHLAGDVSGTKLERRGGRADNAKRRKTLQASRVDFTPALYCSRFLAGDPLPSGAVCKGVVGRFVWGHEDLEEDAEEAAAMVRTTAQLGHGGQSPTTCISTDGMARDMGSCGSDTSTVDRDNIGEPEGSGSGVCAGCSGADNGRSGGSSGTPSAGLGEAHCWVCSEEMMGELLGRTPLQALLRVGYSRPWIAARARCGLQCELIVSASRDVVGRGVLGCVRRQYGDSLGDLLNAHWPQLGGKADAELGPDDAAAALLWHPAASRQERLGQAGWVTPERFLADPSLSNARAFLWHTLDCTRPHQCLGRRVKGPAEIFVRKHSLRRDQHEDEAADVGAGEGTGVGASARYAAGEAMARVALAISPTDIETLADQETVASPAL